MELNLVRKHLDVLDSVIKYALLQRMSLIPLVAASKRKGGLPVFQPEREEKIFDSLRTFCGQTGLNPELLVDIYKAITKDSRRIQHEIIQGTESIDDKINSNISELMPFIEKTNQAAANFIDSMNKLELEMSELDIKEKDIMNVFTGYYKNKH